MELEEIVEYESSDFKLNQTKQKLTNINKT